MTQTNIGAARDSALNGRSVLVVLLAFFGTVFAVNAYFVVVALDTYSGTVASEPYRKGLTYNRRIAADERQAALHWQPRASASRDGHVLFDLAGADGTPVSGLTVTAVLGRPSSEDHDRSLNFAEVAPGHYVADGPALQPGTWVIALQALSTDSSQEPVFQLRNRLWLAP